MPRTKNKRKPKATSRMMESRLKQLVEQLLFVAVGSQGHEVQPFFRNRIPPQNVAEAAIARAVVRRCPRVAYLTKLCRNEKGVNYLAEPIEVELSSCKIEEAAPIFQEHLDAVTHNQQHFICDAYIIAHRVGEIPDKLAEQIFSGLNGWDAPAKWEEK